MTGVAHLSAGAGLGSLIGLACGHPLAGSVVGGLAGLLPDIDHPGSLLGRRMRVLSSALEERCGHRQSPTHTVMFCLPAGVAVGLCGSAVVHVWPVVWAGVVGMTSHLLLDGLTRSGVRPLRVWLPRLRRVGRGTWWVKCWDSIAEAWNRRIGACEGSAWANWRLHGPVLTGDDWRESAVIVAGFLLVVLVVFVL